MSHLKCLTKSALKYTLPGKIFSITLLALALAPLASLAHMDDTPDNPSERAPKPEGIEPVIPLKQNDPTYDLWKKKREDLSEGREPGPINILLRECLTGIAMRKKGLTDPKYFSPTTVDDGRN